MTLVQFAAAGFLAVSIIGLITQSAFLAGLLNQRRNGESPRQGLTRTSVCRVIVASLYVGYGIWALLVPPVVALITSLLLYSGTSALWAMNSAADRRLARGLAPKKTTAKHRIVRELRGVL